MKNLAENKDCDQFIVQELKHAGIDIEEHNQPLRDEVPAKVTGKLTLGGKNVFTFTRAWYYWRIYGDVPLEVARVLYDHPVGKKAVRVVGHCDCPPPEDWAFPKESVLLELGIYKPPDEENPLGSGPTYGELAQMCNSGQITAPRFVAGYHIDSQEGLNFFVATLRAHHLVD